MYQKVDCVDCKEAVTGVESAAEAVASEASLTGESAPQMKDALPLEDTKRKDLLADLRRYEKNLFINT